MPASAFDGHGVRDEAPIGDGPGIQLPWVKPASSQSVLYRDDGRLNVAGVALAFAVATNSILALGFAQDVIWLCFLCWLCLPLNMVFVIYGGNEFEEPRGDADHIAALSIWCAFEGLLLKKAQAHVALLLQAAMDDGPSRTHVCKHSVETIASVAWALLMGVLLVLIALRRAKHVAALRMTYLGFGLIVLLVNPALLFGCATETVFPFHAGMLSSSLVGAWLLLVAAVSSPARRAELRRWLHAASVRQRLHQLHERYLGLEPYAPVPTAPAADVVVEETRLCVICHDALMTHVIVPCGHHCLCTGCAETKAITSCPLCRASVESFLRVWGPVGRMR